MKRIVLMMMVLMMAIVAMAQDIRISSFKQNMTSLIASTQPVKDRTGAVCAVIRFAVKDTKVQIEPNLGVVKTVKRPGELILYVPQGTKRITVRYKNMMPLRDWQIPVAIESKATYDAVVLLREDVVTGGQTSKHTDGHHVYVGAGYNIVTAGGPSIALGFNFNRHNIELGATLGLKKSDDLFFYAGDGSLKAAYNYRPVNVQLAYGYEALQTDFFALMPMVGVSYNMISGSKVNSATSANSSDMKNANSVSGVIGVRLMASLGNVVGLHITPSYHVGLFKDNNCKLLSDNDNTIKQWTDGFNLNIGLLVKF